MPTLFLGGPMITIINQEGLNEIIGKGVLKPLFLTSEVEQAVIEALSDNIAIYTENYGSGGSGGFIGVITENITAGVGMNEYISVLSQYHLEPDEWEFEDLLGSNGEYDVQMQLFVLTEFNILLIFKKAVNV